MSAGRSEQRGLSRPAAVAIVAAALGVAAVLGRRNAPDPTHPRIRRWYKRLDKPAYTPPDALFGAAWPLLETGLAVGGYRLLRHPASAERDLAVNLWLLNMILIGGWTEMFFQRKQLGPSAAMSGAMIVSGAGYVAAAAKVDRTAAVTGVPFVAWLSFATLLAEQIWVRNHAGSSAA
ncbi:TspO/MBR family protein [Sphingomonas sp. PB4P5]|uniref:TspO/MBR family protein n=1 Tax=Parasphingomonas puruogangriensis TaxID=3096155 RepID=UPI002FC9B9F2